MWLFIVLFCETESIDPRLASELFLIVLELQALLAPLIRFPEPSVTRELWQMPSWRMYFCGDGRAHIEWSSTSGSQLPHRHQCTRPIASGQESSGAVVRKGGGSVGEPGVNQLLLSPGHATHLKAGD